MQNKRNIILVDKNYLRPLDVNTLLGNAAKARRELKWKPQINIHTLIDEMINEEMNILNNEDIYNFIFSNNEKIHTLIKN